ncbi:sensor histidine kinase [Kordia sp. SMS9]|uniref:ATP-binding protein n=1 Tax=Kordia sp. SMS9 TaxID=2282170 RepID=UPI0013B477F3|nr:sensor histidine kinase [Kordia sp. SMS9]
MKLLYYFLCITIWCSVYTVTAQKKSKIDSLKKRLTVQSGIAKVKTLDELTFQLRKKQDSSGIKYAQQGLELSRSIKYVKGEVDAINLLGRIAIFQNRIKDAETYFVEALRIAKKEGYNHGIARGYNELGLLYKNQKKTLKAIDAFLSSSISFEAQKNLKAAIVANRNLGDLYTDVEVYSSALKYYLKGLDLSEKANDSLGLGRIYRQLASLDADRENYAEMLENALQAKRIFTDLERSNDIYPVNILIGMAYDYLNQDEKAEKIYLETLEMASEYDIEDTSDLFHNLATLYKEMGKSEAALEYYKKAQEIFKADKDFPRLTTNYNNLGNLYVSINQKEKAFENFQLSLALQKQVQDSSLLQKTYQSLANYYEQLNEYQIALEYKDSSEYVQSDIYKKIKAADRYQVTYIENKQKEEAAKNKAEFLLKETQRKNQIIIIILVAAILLFFVILRSRKLKQAKKVAELAYEQQKITAQLERELQEKKLEEMLQEQERKAINSMVSGQEEERARIAKDLHDRLGSMLSVVKIHYKSVEDDLEKIKKETKSQYEKANQLLDEACETVRKIAHNMVSGTLTKFGLLPALKELKQKIEETKTIKVELLAHGLDNRLGNSTEIQLYRVVQELLNNVLKHANATEVTIQLLKRENELNIMVTDNGIGFDTQEILYEGMGLRSVKARIVEMGGRVLIDSNKGNGTTVTVEIPT